MTPLSLEEHATRRAKWYGKRRGKNKALTQALLKGMPTEIDRIKSEISSMKLLVTIATLLASASVFSAPFVVSDPVASTVTHCGWVMDGGAKQDIAVAKDGTNTICKRDVGTVDNGSHTVTATAVIIDPVWGRQESAASAPFTFVRPVSPSAPSGLGLQP